MQLGNKNVLGCRSTAKTRRGPLLVRAQAAQDSSSSKCPVSQAKAFARDVTTKAAAGLGAAKKPQLINVVGEVGGGIEAWHMPCMHAGPQVT